jgi:hypothetical protein
MLKNKEVMRRLLTSGLLTLLLFTYATLCGTLSAQTTASPAGAAGTIWGGEHIHLQITTDGGIVEFDCASGTITNPVRVDAQGQFRLTGMFTREQPGPVRKDQTPTTTAATYSGDIVGDTMRLSIRTGPQNEAVGEYVLTRASAGHVVKCR